jgi:CPA2 family monovalent cation:H+ antiporter-2
MGTRHGKASFGILLLQDLAVVPLLVVVELLAKGGTGLGKALSIAGMLLGQNRYALLIKSEI